MATEFNEDNFQTEVLESDQPVLVDFWAEWCGPCRQLTPVIEQLATDNEGVAKIGKVDVEANQALSEKYGVQFLPTILLFKGGDVVETITGAVPLDRLQQMINSHVPA